VSGKNRACCSDFWPPISNIGNLGAKVGVFRRCAASFSRAEGWLRFERGDGFWNMRFVMETQPVCENAGNSFRGQDRMAGERRREKNGGKWLKRREKDFFVGP
jgi:hypothetical protein